MKDVLVNLQNVRLSQVSVRYQVPDRHCIWDHVFKPPWILSYRRGNNSKNFENITVVCGVTVCLLGQVVVKCLSYLMIVML